MKFNGKVTIVEKKAIYFDTIQIVVERPSDMTEIRPGQFFNLVSNSVGYPMLRRPISVSGFSAETIEFTLKIVGKGTKSISEMSVGDKIEIMGPLGNGFEIGDVKKVLIVGGGIGVAPVKCLIQNWVNPETNIDVVLGFRDEPYLVEPFELRAHQLEIFSENNLSYKKGYVTEGVKNLIMNHTYDMVYACGPHVMLKSLSELCNKEGVTVQLLMEEKMACGIGACLVCTCKIRAGEFGYKHVRMCADGPMFYGSEVIFNE